jgi:2-phosphosulfolactate phosphatase
VRPCCGTDVARDLLITSAATGVHGATATIPIRHDVPMRSNFIGIADVHEVPKLAVVIDVMRAFTVAAWAFARGAQRIVFAETLDSALDLKARHPGWLALQDGAPLPGFDLVNSPALLRSLNLEGRTIVQKTTAGTVGALSVADAEIVLCASFVVAEATSSFLVNQKPDEVTFVVTGDDGHAEEDMACAEYIARRTAVSEVDAAPYIERARNSTAAGKLAEGAGQGYRGIHPDDVDLCLDLNRFPFVMSATRGRSHMVLRPTHSLPAPTPAPSAS